MKPEKILVVGATGGSGRATVERLLSEGYEVTAFSRRPEGIGIHSEGLHYACGDAMDPAAMEQAVAGQDAVIVALGINENPLWVRLFGSSRTPLNVRSAGTRNVIAAMHKHGVRRLVVQSSFGVGETRGNLRLLERLFFSLLLKPQIADMEIQELEVRESGVDWVLAQPVHLTNENTGDMPFASTSGNVRQWKVSRKGVARFLAKATHTSEHIGQSVALSGGGAS